MAKFKFDSNLERWVKKALKELQKDYDITYNGTIFVSRMGENYIGLGPLNEKSAIYSIFCKTNDQQKWFDSSARYRGPRAKVIKASNTNLTFYLEEYQYRIKYDYVKLHTEWKMSVSRHYRSQVRELDLDKGIVLKKATKEKITLFSVPGMYAFDVRKI